MSLDGEGGREGGREGGGVNYSCKLFLTMYTLIIIDITLICIA